MEPAGLKPPIVLGHENAGWVHAVGSDVTTAEPGDAVLVYPPYSCGLCVNCRRGLDMHCDRHQFYGLTRDGGFADYVLVDERSLVPLPEGVEPAAVAPHADAGLTAIHAVKRLLPRLTPGTTSAVIGVGGVGHIALQLLKVLGGGSVIAIDNDERRRKLASELGADQVLDRHRRPPRGDERRGRRRDHGLRRHRRHPRREPGRARPARPLLDRRLRRARSPSRRWRWWSASPRSRATWSGTGSTSGSCSSCTRRGDVTSAHGNAPARGRERRAGQAARGRHHRPRRVGSRYPRPDEHHRPDRADDRVRRPVRRQLAALVPGLSAVLQVQPVDSVDLLHRLRDPDHCPGQRPVREQAHSETSSDCSSARPA